MLLKDRCLHLKIKLRDARMIFTDENVFEAVATLIFKRILDQDAKQYSSNTMFFVFAILAISLQMSVIWVRKIAPAFEY